MAGRVFSATIEGFADLTFKNMEYVARTAIDDVMETAMTSQPSVKLTGGAFEVGKIPVDVGDLINSLVSDVNGAPAGAGPDSYVTAIGEFELGDVMRFAWKSDHAMPMELGFTTANGGHVPGRHFVGMAAAKWGDFVAARVAEVRK